MKLVIVTETFPPEINGVAMTLKRIVCGLIEKGHRVTVIHPKKDAESDACYSNFFVTGMTIPMYPELKIGLCTPRALKKAWKSNKPDLVHVATEGPLGFVAIRAALQCGIPVTSSFHTNFHTYTSHYKLQFFQRGLLHYLRYTHNKTERTFVPCSSVLEELKDLDFKNLRIMGRGVDCELFNPSKRSDTLRKSWNVQSGDRVVLYVGRIAAEKNIELAVRSFRSMKEKCNALHFVLVGDGPMKNQLENENPDFHFAGMQRGEDLARHYASGDIFLFPSVSETYGNVLMEAMASGLTCLAYDYAAAKEHIQSEVNGFSVPMHDQEAFISTSNSILESENLSSLRSAARKKAETVGWPSIVDQFEKDLNEVLQP